MRGLAVMMSQLFLDSSTISSLSGYSTAVAAASGKDRYCCLDSMMRCPLQTPASVSAFSPH